MTKKNANLGQNAFTLIELMIVLAIVAIIATLAIPSYSLHQARARTKEAVIGLSAIFPLQIAFHAETGTYSACLRQLGYAPSGDKTGASTGVRYYFIGASSTQAARIACGAGGAFRCDAYVYFSTGADPSALCLRPIVNFNADLAVSDAGYAATTRANPATVISEANTMQNSIINYDGFIYFAGGNISPSSTRIDSWSMNNSKALRHELDGTY